MTTDTLLLIASEWIGVIALGMLAGISPKLLKVRPLQFLYPHREASIVFSLNIAVFVFSLFLYKYYFTAATNFSILNPDAITQRLILDIVVVLVFIVALIMRKQPIRSALIGKDALRGNLEYGILIAALVIFLRGKIFTIIDGVSSAEGLALVELLVIGLCEAIIFFGFSQPRLIARFGEKTGWLMAAGLFALWQIVPLALHGASGQMALFQILLAIGLGVVAGWTTLKSRHVLAPAIYIALSQWLFLLQ